MYVIQYQADVRLATIHLDVKDCPSVEMAIDRGREALMDVHSRNGIQTGVWKLLGIEDMTKESWNERYRDQPLDAPEVDDGQRD